MSPVRSRPWPPNLIEIGKNSDFFFFIDSRIKPNTRGCFAFGEFSVVCGNDRTAWPFGDDSAREVSPPCDFSQHDVFEERRPFCRFPMQTASLVCAPCFIDRFKAKRELHAASALGIADSCRRQPCISHLRSIKRMCGDRNSRYVESERQVFIDDE